MITAVAQSKDITTSDDGADDLVSALLTASRALVGVSARSLARVEDAVTITQFRTLVVLEGHGDTRLNQLAERVGVTPSTALRMVDRLIAAHLVTRRENKADRREVLIALTVEGTRLVREITARRRAEIAAIVAAMPREGRQGVVAALNAFAQAAGEATPSIETATRLGW
jgi:DNA-binding MarR family transcriptional regulator